MNGDRRSGARPTLEAVAARAGVGRGTVSRVINNSPLVVEPTRARVQAAVEDLGYRLNATARNLSIGRAMAVGVVVPFLTAPSVIERLRGVSPRSLRAADINDLAVMAQWLAPALSRPSKTTTTSHTNQDNKKTIRGGW